MSDRLPSEQTGPFERFVQKIAAVPKEAVEDLDVRDRSIKVKRRRKVTSKKP